MQPGPRSRVGLLALVVACGDLVEPPRSDAQLSNQDVTLIVEPPLIEDRAAPIVHFQLEGLPSDVHPRPALLVGRVTTRNLRDLDEEDVGETLRKRIVDASVWRNDDGDWIVVPPSALEFGSTYSVVAPTLRWSWAFDVMDRDEVAVLSRVWPPVQGAGELGLWCLDWPATGYVPKEPRLFSMVPGIDGVLDWGAFDGFGRGCLRWRVQEVREAFVAPPPIVTLLDGAMARMDPAGFSIAPQEALWVTPACEGGEGAVGPTCARVLDDRAILSVLEGAWLVDLEIGDQRWVNTVAADTPWVVRPLAPSSEIAGFIRFVSSSGAEEGFDLAWRTSESLPHVVINEVMANPAGPEPHQEWVELYNDGSGEVSLEGWRFEDAGGSTELPGVTLRAGDYALLVGEGYDANSWVDAAPAPGALMVVVSSLGKSGLSNAGEPVRLVRGDGVTASWVPAIPSKEQGWSIVRIRPEALDEHSGSFAFGKNGGTPGRANEGWEARE